MGDQRGWYNQFNGRYWEAEDEGALVSVGVCHDGQVQIDHGLEGVVLSRNTARVLARRINQALDETSRKKYEKNMAIQK